jgi:hypothetical protein
MDPLWVEGSVAPLSRRVRFLIAGGTAVIFAKPIPTAIAHCYKIKG